jgi:asparagine synthase (glutamine-hydrolysing)
MSGIAGIYHLDGRPVDPALLTRMTDSIAHRGPDASGHWIDGSVGLGHRMLHTTPESLQEKQPLLDETGHLVLTLDGRVDNRDELQVALAAEGAKLRTDTDAELVLRAYEYWGDECPQRIIGDFAFVVWDRRQRRLFCARDIVGIKPFYYSTEGRTFRWGSEIKQFFTDPTFPLRPNEGMMGEYLCVRLVDAEETLYQGILRLPPAHVLTVHDGQLRQMRYFDIDPDIEIRYSSNEAYAEHFYAIFKEAVRCRLRSPSPVSVFLSGGLDSSAIVGMAQHLAREGEIPGHGVEAYSLVCSEPAADERTYIEDVVKMWGINAHFACPDGWVPPSLRDQVLRVQDFPDSPNMSPWEVLYTMARARGSRVVLWGHGGDEWLTGHSTHCADLLRQFRIPTLLRQIRHDLQVRNLWGGGGVGLRDALQWCLFPLILPRIPQPMKSLVRPLVSRELPGWIAPAFAHRIALRERLRRSSTLPRFPTLAQRAIYGQLGNGQSVAEYEWVNRFESGLSMEGRSPFNDRRLIEFALAIPEEQRWHGHQTKFVLRQAARELLPESVRQRLSKADFSYLYPETFTREKAEDVFTSLRLASDGFVDAAQAERICRQACQGAMQYLAPVWMILATERWYSTMFPSEVSPTSQRSDYERQPSA